MAAKKHHTTQARITAILLSALAGCTTPPSFIPEWTVTWTEWNWSRPGATQSQLNTEFAACEKQTAVAVASSVIPGSKAPGGTPAWRAALKEQIKFFDTCMRVKGWHKAPVGPNAPSSDDRGGG